MSTNPFLEPVNINTGQITTRSPDNEFEAPYIPPTTNSPSFIDGATGFLTKAFETGLDAFELYTRYDTAKDAAKQAERVQVVGANRQNPSITQSAAQAQTPLAAGIDPNTMKLVGAGVVFAGLLTVGVIFAATRK